MTIRILLVDDEKLERIAQRKMLEHHRPDVEICGEAANGEEALDLIRDKEPDLVCLDIQMPGKSGIDVVRAIEQHHPKIRVIMITAYDTFDYARDVMRAGVREYLLKPVAEKELIESIDRLGEDILQEKRAQQEQQKQEERIEMYVASMRANRILALLMDYHVDGMDEEMRDDPLSNATAVLAISLPKGDAPALIALRESITDELTRLNPGCLVGPVLGSHIPAFLTGNTAASLSQLLQSFISAIQRNTEMEIAVGASEGIETDEDFGRAYQEAVAALTDVKNAKGANYQLYRESAATQATGTRFKAESELIERVKHGDEGNVIADFEQYFSTISAEANYQPARLKQELDEFFIVLHRALTELGVNTGRFDATVMTSMTQLRQQALTHVKQTVKDVDNWRDADMEHSLEQVRRFIDTHYRSSLSLDEVADYAGLSMYYVSKLFKERFGVSFTRYVTDLRLTDAKRMLADSSISLKEIALELGYRDPNYFSRVFKKEVGISPTVYRDQARAFPGT
ncbi:response regulator transcription factor [Salisediminibacterium beveridgei]|uniref:Putative transcriptional regulatory protein yesN n=1 Tax=Salisediminibacterium beveridgei TaxID=632773 RepID=A0A1D7QRF7_9BACI|nr:response regulator [Salisediminibacterium beveridgei]AOM81588.1 putative transcriptional regulatory protein yesN [Salisediminibacterium beveridgei]